MPASTAVIDSGAPTVAARDAGSAAPAASSTPFFDWQHATPTYDGTLPVSTAARLRGVGPHEAWLEMPTAQKWHAYAFTVDLETGCVTSTLPIEHDTGLASVEILRGEADFGQAVLREDVRHDVTARLAVLARLDLSVSAGQLVPGRSDGHVAMSPDRSTVAVVVGDRLYIDDGSGQFRRLGDRSMMDFEELAFASDRYLTFFAQREHPDKPTYDLCIADVTRPDATMPCFDQAAYQPARAFTPDGHPLFVGVAKHCIYDVDPGEATPTMHERACFQAAGKPGQPLDVSVSPHGQFGRILEGDFATTKMRVFPIDPAHATEPARAVPGKFDLHNFSIGPDDQGHVAWDHFKPGWRRFGPDGTFDIVSQDLLVGFAGDGQLLFLHPPPKNATLDDVKCSLIRRVDPGASKPKSPKETKSP